MTEIEEIARLRELANCPGDPMREPRRSHVARYHSALAKAWETGQLVAAAQLAAMTAERDALVGAAYTACAEWIEETACCARVDFAARIRALATSDHHAALEAVKAKARAEGMRKAAAICMSEDVGNRYDDCYRAILAAAQKEAGK